MEHKNYFHKLKKRFGLFLTFIIIALFCHSIFSYYFNKNTAHLFMLNTFKGCETCEKTDEILLNLKGYGTKFDLKIYNLSDYGNLAETLKIIGAKTGNTIIKIPFLVIGNKVYQGESEIKKNIKEIEILLNSKKVKDNIRELNYKSI